MTRLATWGYDTLDTAVTTDEWVAESTLGTAITKQVVSGTTSDTTLARTGGCLRITGQSWHIIGVPLAVGTTYFLRFYFRIEANPAAVLAVCAPSLNATRFCYINLTADGTLVLQDGSFAPIGRQSGDPISLGVWHRVELRFKIGSSTTNGAAELVVDGVTKGSNLTTANLGNAAGNNISLGSINANATGAAGIRFDDCALNDSNGTVNNTYPGDAKVSLLLPTSDSARGTNWVAGGGGTTSLFDAVNNVPPVGKAAASATNTTQIRNAASDTTSFYDMGFPTYASAGITSADKINAVQAVASMGTGVATSVKGGIQMSANPVIAERVQTAPAAAVGTHGSNWIGVQTVASENPAVTPTVSPVVRLRKGIASTNALNFDFVGVYVDWTPASDTTPPISTFISETATKVSAVTGKDSTAVTWNVNEAGQAWQLRVVPDSSSPVTAGTLLASGGAVPANNNQVTTITEAALVAAGAVEGSNTLKVFVQDLAGNWSV